jgi:hypothetical protein
VNACMPIQMHHGQAVLALEPDPFQPSCA